MTEHIPTRDTMTIKSRSRLTGATMIGLNCSGISVPDAGKLGIMPVSIFEPGGAASVTRVLSFNLAAPPRKKLTLYGRRVPPLPRRRPK